jgi:hypothetical protein
MKRKLKIISISLLGLISLLCIFGCSEPDYRGQDIPVYITYNNHVYENSGETVAKEKAPQNVNYIGQAAWEGQTISQSASSEESFEVYTIQGIDKNTAIAVKILLVSEKDAYYFYFKYVIQS